MIRKKKAGFRYMEFITNAKKKRSNNLITMHNFRFQNRTNITWTDVMQNFRFQKIGIQHFAMESLDEFLKNAHKQIRAA